MDAGSKITYLIAPSDTPLRKIPRSFNNALQIEALQFDQGSKFFLFKKEINAFDSFGIERLIVTTLPVDVSYGNALMILTERNFVLVLWMLRKVVLFLNSLYNSCLLTAF